MPYIFAKELPTIRIPGTVEKINGWNAISLHLQERNVMANFSLVAIDRSSTGEERDDAANGLIRNANFGE